MDLTVTLAQKQAQRGLRLPQKKIRTLIIFIASALLSCQNYNLYDRLTCPGCVAGQSDKSTNATTPCVNCRIFVSQTTRGDMSGNGGCGGAGGGTAFCGIGANGVQKADYVCQNDPGRPDTAKVWKALVVDGTNRVACTNANCTGGTAGRVDWILKPNTAYFRPDNVTLIMNTVANAVFAFGFLTNVINNTVAYSAWTGLNTNWTTGTTHCTNWSIGTNAVQGIYGTSSLNDGQSINAGTPVNCDTLNNLYCVEQ